MTNNHKPKGSFTVPVHERFFEDYAPGLSCTYESTTITEEAILTFAREFDPQSMHTDPTAAADGPFKGLIASGWHTGSLVMNATVNGYLNEAASLASPGVDELRWVRPVRPGDALTVQFTVLDAKASRTKPDRGIVNTAIEVFNQRAEVVMTMTAINMIRRRPHT